MGRNLISRRPIGRWTRVALTAISLAATTSGCATWLGYVPEHVRPGDNITQAPSYAEVKEWAYGRVKSARNESERLTSNQKAAQHKVNGAVDQEHNKARDATAKAEVALSGARNDFNDVTGCSDPWIASTGFEKAVHEGEALCLRDDVNDVMRRAEAHIALLDPRNVADRLRSAVRATASGASEPMPNSSTATPNDAATGSAPNGTEPVVAAAATDDLSDLIPPIQSRCGYF